MELSLWNVMGRRIDVLDEGWCNAGRHQIAWNGEDLSSGVYLLHLMTVNNPDKITRKVLLLK
jgi:hypothetical protein